MSVLDGVLNVLVLVLERWNAGSAARREPRPPGSPPAPASTIPSPLRALRDLRVKKIPLVLVLVTSEAVIVIVLDTHPAARRSLALPDLKRRGDCERVERLGG